MKKKIIIDANFPDETRVALLDKNNDIEHVEFSDKENIKIRGNIYLAKITRIEPSLQAAFVDYGEEKSGFLPFSEIHEAYYHTPCGSNNSTNITGEEINSNIADHDLSDKHAPAKQIEHLIEKDDVSPEDIEQMLDSKQQSNYNIDAEDDEIETISTNHKSAEEKQYKIQEVLKKGQVLLVQVTKSERGNKGASLTTYISLAGKYCVLIPNKPNQNGISRKISNNDERRRLKNIIETLAPSSGNTPHSIIMRTAGVGHSTLEIKRDYDYLAKLWNKIREATISSKAPCFIHQEDGVLLKTIRDLFDKSVKEVFVQGAEGFELCKKFINEITPSLSKNIKEYKGKTPIFTKFGIEKQLINLYQPIVHLPSGGYIVINPTEALISIDVNSGKATTERNVEETALKTNLEAAKAIAQQCNLRDLSGLIVIDFIDLLETKHRKILERSIWEYFSKDKARIQTSSISNFGLFEMSRQRLRPTFLELNSKMCNNCSGKGLVRADSSNAMLILRTIENELLNAKTDIVNVYSSSASVLYILNNKRDAIEQIEKKYNIKLNFNIDSNANADSYSIEKVKLSNIKPKDKVAKPVIGDALEIYHDLENNSEEVSHKRKIRKRKNKPSRNEDIEVSKEKNKAEEAENNKIAQEEKKSNHEVEKADKELGSNAETSASENNTEDKSEKVAKKPSKKRTYKRKKTQKDKEKVTTDEK